MEVRPGGRVLLVDRFPVAVPLAPVAVEVEMRSARVSPADVAIPIGFMAGLKWWGRYGRIEVIGGSDINEVEEVAADSRPKSVGHRFGIAVERHASGGHAVQQVVDRVRLFDKVDRD